MKPILSQLYRLDPEWVHDATLRIAAEAGRWTVVLKLLESLYRFEDRRLTVTMGNLRFPNPIGLAAGFDKNGVAVPVLQTLGFGFIETGTVTPAAQSGNPVPRLFRLKDHQAIINRMGFNNQGAAALSAALKNLRRQVPIGVNLGKNHLTPLTQANEDYLLGMRQCWSVADYLVINISSPNTEGLRDLQRADTFESLVRNVRSVQEELTERSGQKRQVWFKIAPDLDQDELTAIAEIALAYSVDALVLTNTTNTRTGLPPTLTFPSGGLSGQPLFDLSNRVLAEMHRLTAGRIPLIGVGGVATAEQAAEKIRLGARLVQLYTAMVFEGPGIVRKIKKGLVQKLCQTTLRRQQTTNHNG
jgi:dihydroorotate dehydrogenase